MNEATPNALLGHEAPPRFDLFDATQVVPTIRALIAKQNQDLDALEANCTPTWADLIERVNAIAEPLSFAWRTVHHLLGVKNDPALREAEETVRAEVIGAGLRISQSRVLYDGYRALRDGPEWQTFTPAQRRIVESAIRSAEQSGVGLDGKDKDTFIAIETALGEAATRFSNNVLDATKSFELILTDRNDVDGLPPTLLAAAAQSARLRADALAQTNQALSARLAAATPEHGPWRITLDAPVFVPFMEHSTNRALRETIYRAYITRASAGEFDNQPVLLSILKHRKDKARLLGFPDFAALSLSRKMAGDVARASALLDELRAVARPAAVREHEELVAFARSETGDPALELQHWDIAFWAERLRKRRYDFDDEALRPYFALPAVLKGLFGLAERLFGISIEAADGSYPVWHPDVRTFRVRDTGGEPLAEFFLDPYSRPENKRGGAWMDTCLDRKRRPDGSVRLPVAYLVCNQSPPVDGKPSLMTFSEVETLFHEFGHGLQHMLTRVDYVDAAGINNIEWDAVELPSQFMENWCYHRETLLGFARHFETGAPLPEALFQRITEARVFRAGSQFLRQLYFATLDLALHHDFAPNDVSEIEAQKRKVAAENTVLPPLPEDRFLAAFTHIFAGGYAAGYYSYKWAEVLAADAFSAFEEAGLDNPPRLAEVGRRFRDTVLALGGGTHPAEVFRAFRGRDPDPGALLRSYGLVP